MIYDHRTTISFQKNLTPSAACALSFQGFGKNRTEGTPARFAVLEIEGFAYREKTGVWKSRLPYSDEIFKGTSANLCVFTEAPRDWFSDTNEQQFLKISELSEGGVTTIYWNIKDIEYLMAIKQCFESFDSIGLDLYLGVRDSYFQQTDLDMSKEISIATITLSYP